MGAGQHDCESEPVHRVPGNNWSAVTAHGTCPSASTHDPGSEGQVENPARRPQQPPYEHGVPLNVEPVSGSVHMVVLSASKQRRLNLTQKGCVRGQQPFEQHT